MFLLKPMQQSPHLDCVIVEPELSGFGRGDFFLPKGRLLLSQKLSGHWSFLKALHSLDD